MDDIFMEDPRRASAKKIVKKTEIKVVKRRTVWQYLFDLVIKTLVLATLVSLNFTMFANAGSYGLFSSSPWVNMDARLIYLSIGVLSFVLMFVASFLRWLENVLLAAGFALFGVAVINQFATFEKQSALLILFNGIFSDDMNLLLYQYSSWIIGASVFVIIWMLLCCLSRQFIFYIWLALAAVLGWLFSEAYLNPSSQYYKETSKASKVVKSDNIGKNLVFLSFKNLTSPLNLKKMYEVSPKYENIDAGYKNALGFYSQNNFILYPNAAVSDVSNPWNNLILSYNPDDADNVAKHVSTSISTNKLFDFSRLQPDRVYMKNNSLYDMLKKDNYSINVLQTGLVNTCYIGSKISVDSCKEKVNNPTALNSAWFPTIQRSLLLVAQWLHSTGFVTSVNPIIKTLDYVYYNPDLFEFGVDVDKLDAINSFKAFDAIVEAIDRGTGNQAFFAVLDIPSESFVYDEFCQLKDMKKWTGENLSVYTKVPVDARRAAYADQVSCLYGHLEKFLQQLDKSGYLENTTIVIQGLNNPQGLKKDEKDVYLKYQEERQVALAIRPADAQKPKMDYSVCEVTDLLGAFFMKDNRCIEFEKVKTTEKNTKNVRNIVEKDKWSNGEIAEAQSFFSNWFSKWKKYNWEDAVSTDDVSEDSANDTMTDVKEIKEVKVAEDVVKDIPEEKLKSIRVVSDSDEVKELPSETEINDIEKVEVKEVEVEPKPMVEVEDITHSEQKPQSDVKLIQEDVIPDVVLEEVTSTEKEISEADAAIIRAKEQLAKKRADVIKTVEKAEQTVSKEIAAQKEKLRNVLEASVSDNGSMTPEELKKQYRKALEDASASGKSIVDIKVNVVEK